MRLLSRALWPALVLSACTGGAEVPGMRLSGVNPVQGEDDAEVTLQVEGDHFLPRARTDFSRPGASALDAGFRVGLVRADAEAPEIDLGPAELVDSTRLRVKIAAGVPRGFYGVMVTDPRGRVAMLPEVYRVVRAKRNVAGFRIEPVGQQRVGVAFMLQATAVDAQGETVDGFSGEATLSDSSSSIAPATMGPFALGRARVSATIVKPWHADVIRLEDAEQHSGVSEAFDVLTGLPVQVAFGTASPTVGAGACSPLIDLQLQDAQRRPAPPTTPLHVDLAAAPPDRFGFYSDAACTAAIEAIFISGEARGSFFVRGERAGTITVRAQPDQLPGASLPVTIAPGPVDRVEFTSPSQVLAKGACSEAVGIEPGDAYGNRQQLAQAATLALAAQPAGALAFFADAACATALSDLTLPASDSGATLFVRGEIAGTSTLRATPSNGLGAGELVFTVTP